MYKILYLVTDHVVSSDHHRSEWRSCCHASPGHTHSVRPRSDHGAHSPGHTAPGHRSPLSSPGHSDTLHHPCPRPRDRSSQVGISAPHCPPGRRSLPSSPCDRRRCRPHSSHGLHTGDQHSQLKQKNTINSHCFKSKQLLYS